jgi:hypothetical protein
MPITATLQRVDTTGDSAEVWVTLEYPGLSPETRPYKFRSGDDLLAANVAAFVLAAADRIEALVARGLELREAVGQDCYALLSDDPAPQPHPTLDVVLQDVAVTYDAVTLAVRVTHRASGRTVVKGLPPFSDAAQLSRSALQALFATEAPRLAGLNEIVPNVLALQGVDLVAWARAGAPVPGGDS